MSLYLVQNHVHICVMRDATVLLDLRQDQYHGLDSEQTRMLGRFVRGWPAQSTTEDCARGDGANDSQSIELAEYLVNQGMLTRDEMTGREWKSVELPLPEARLHEWDGKACPRITITLCVEFAIACVRALVLLKVRSLENAVSIVRTRKVRHSAGADTALVGARERAWVFRTLRPFFYTPKDRCLFDSLVMIEFLAMNRIYPTWVVGVQARPFAAHSWVQLERYTLNAPPELARAFSPILAV